MSVLKRAAWGFCAGAALPGCLAPASYERSDLPADLQAPIRQSATLNAPPAPTSRGQIDAGQGPSTLPVPVPEVAATPAPPTVATPASSPVTQVNWVRPGEVPLPAIPAVPSGPLEVPAIAQPPTSGLAGASQLPSPKAVPKNGAPPKLLDVPPGLPGSQAPPIELPADKPQRLKVIDKLFPAFPPLGPDPVVDGMPGVKPVSLEELLDFAMKNSPDVAQARAEVASAHGLWVQAGLYRNPTVGFQGDQMLDFGFPGQLGGFFNQSIVTGGKLKVARSVAFFDFLNARVQLRKVEVELARRVRGQYYAALVAAENVRVSRLIVAFTDEVYRRQVELVKGGTAAAYEASALLAVTGYADLVLAQSRQRYNSAWKQLAATINAPNMGPAPLLGKVDETLPRYHYEALREQMLAIHTDLVVARNLVAQAERVVNREQLKPLPDLQNQFYFQQDTQARAQGQQNFQMGAQIGVTVPLFDRNQGAIMWAQAMFARANAEVPRVQNILLVQLADAFERYETARQQTELYRVRILPNLVTAFRGVYQRYQVDAGPDKVNYNDIVTAQQNLVVQLGGYMQALAAQWQALADLAGAVQVTDPAELQPTPETPLPDTWPDATPRGLPSPKK
jgi:outer membrane protein, heavy metal efflux system